MCEPVNIRTCDSGIIGENWFDEAVDIPFCTYFNLYIKNKNIK